MFDMEGIIYKFTILTDKSFYVGQHIGKHNFDSYWGSGVIWLKKLKRVQSKFPNCWKKLIKREILWCGRYKQTTLDKLEEFYIKREHALYEEKMGGCNILTGTANGFGSINPTKIDFVKKKISIHVKQWWNEHPEEKEKVSKRRKGVKSSMETRKKISESIKGMFAGEKNPMYGKKVSDETRKKMSISQSARKKRRPHTEYTKRLIAETRKQYAGEKHPLYGCHFIWINDGIVNKRHNGDEIPAGWKRGRIKIKQYESKECKT